MVSDFSVLLPPSDIVNTLQLREMWEMMVYSEAEMIDETELCTRATPHPKLDTNEMEKMCFILHEISLCRVLIKSAIQTDTKQWAITNKNTKAKCFFDSDFCSSREKLFFCFRPCCCFCVVLPGFRVSISLMRIRTEPLECCSKQYFRSWFLLFSVFVALSFHRKYIFSIVESKRITGVHRPRRHENKKKDGNSRD